MIDADMLRAFKQGAYLVNCARGGIVDEAAVAEAVRDGRLSGFATDVFSAEPLAAGHPFLAEDIAERIVITPHICLLYTFSRRRWLINIQSVKVNVGGGETRKLHICTKCLRSGKVQRAV